MAQSLVNHRSLTALPTTSGCCSTTRSQCGCTAHAILIHSAQQLQPGKTACFEPDLCHCSLQPATIAAAQPFLTQLKQADSQLTATQHSAGIKRCSAGSRSISCPGERTARATPTHTETRTQTRTDTHRETQRERDTARHTERHTQGDTHR